MKILFLLIFIPSFIFAQGSSKGVSSLKLPLTPFSTATAESFVADPANLQSIRINPANISSQKSYSILFSHTEWMLDTRTEYFSVSAPFRFGSLAFSFSNTSVNDIEVREIPGTAIGLYDFRSSVFQLTYGNEVASNIKIGIAAKYLYEKNFVNEATGFAFDAGILYFPSLENLVIAFSISDIGTMSALRKEKIELPSTLRIGGTYSISWNDFHVKAASSFSSELGSTIKHINFGGELNYNKLFAFRIGYHTGYEIRSVSVGLGLCYDIAILDYAYLPFGLQVGSSHLISICFIL